MGIKTDCLLLWMRQKYVYRSRRHHQMVDTPPEYLTEAI